MTTEEKWKIRFDFFKKYPEKLDTYGECVVLLGGIGKIEKNFSMIRSNGIMFL